MGVEVNTSWHALVVFHGVDYNYPAVRWRGSVPPSVCIVAVCHSLPLPATQEICPHPLTEDAEVSLAQRYYRRVAHLGGSSIPPAWDCSTAAWQPP